MNYPVIYVFLGFIIIFKLVNNLLQYIYLKKFYKKFRFKYGVNSVVPSVNLSQYAIKLSEILLNAGILVSTLPLHIDRLYVNQKGNPFDYLDNDNKVVNEKINIWVLQAIGVYKQRMIDSVNPIYWVKTLLFLPQIVVSYFGGDSKGSLSKILNVFWWIIASLISIFSSDIREWILALIESYK